MSKTKTWLRRGAVGLAALTVAVVGGAAATRAFFQYETAERLRIDTQKGVQESGFVKLPSGEQWVVVRGENIDNPVLLIVHGGGVATSLFAEDFKSWEKDFTVVHWDRRDHGKSLSHADNRIDPDQGVDSFVADGIALTEDLRKRLHKPRIALLGWSWGSRVSLTMAHQRPDLFSVYVGTGQAVDNSARDRHIYDHMLAVAKTGKHPELLAKLTGLGPPPYDPPSRWKEVDDLEPIYLKTEGPKKSDGQLYAQALAMPDWSVKDLLTYKDGGRIIRRQRTLAVYNANNAWTAAPLGRDFAMPMVLIQGEYDHPDFVRPWFDGLKAPSKQLVVLPGTGHAAIQMQSVRFGQALHDYVLPLAKAREYGAPAPVSAVKPAE
ncbi:alpha/beta fold hydrolase [Caulobacter hibisci]|uniref:Proline iminopeptidase n=1 Tax=Caulobacter hibisci TaxID=2035993 RepID=A0ABS0SRC1_9CAUL|nr:alpha/beta hydrolase [Caulobacter hibisci]MBI1682145.1 alpha/beta hydrolase [Caulobacter hibisci]